VFGHDIIFNIEIVVNWDYYENVNTVKSTLIIILGKINAMMHMTGYKVWVRRSI
jgi:hypothetical protein